MNKCPTRAEKSLQNNLFFLFIICVFCLATIYYKPTSTNIEIHINRLIPLQRGEFNVDKQVREWNYVVKKAIGE